MHLTVSLSRVEKLMLLTYVKASSILSVMGSGEEKPSVRIR